MDGESFIDITMRHHTTCFSKGEVVSIEFTVDESDKEQLLDFDEQQVLIKIPSLFDDPLIGNFNVFVHGCRLLLNQ